MADTFNVARPPGQVQSSLTISIKLLSIFLINKICSVLQESNFMSRILLYYSHRVNVLLKYDFLSGKAVRLGLQTYTSFT